MANKGFNVQEFKSVIDRGGGLKLGSRFLVEFPVPEYLERNRRVKNNVGGRAGKLSFYCKAAAIPGIGVMSADVYRYGYGPIERKPYGTVFNDVMMMFYIDGEGQVDEWMYEWVRSIINFNMANGIGGEFYNMDPSAEFVRGAGPDVEPYFFRYKKEYAVDLKITTFDPEGRFEKAIVLSECYPNYIGDKQVDWDEKNQLTMLPVSFTFKDWYPERYQTGPRIEFTDDPNANQSTPVPDSSDTK
jgi:hypothetical protein